MAKENSTFPHVGLLIAGWWLLTFAIQVGLLQWQGFDWNISLIDSFATQGLLGLGAFAISLLLRYYRPEKKNLWRLFDWTLIMAVVITFFQQLALSQIISERSYMDFLKQTLPIRGLIDWLIIVLTAMASWLWSYLHDQQEADLRRTDTEKLAREAELSALRQQLNPHFLFNSLNSISALVVSRPDEARNMVQQLSDFLRGTLKKDDQQLVGLDEELRHLQLYLDIEKVRFGHRLSIDIQKWDDILDFKLPSLLLQPIVENAIKFGLYDTVDNITISISARTENKSLVLEIKNPFDPATSSPRQGTGFGLSSVRRRLYLIYLRNDLLATSQHENIFSTTIKIPQSV